MKRTIIFAFSGILVLCCLGGCSTQKTVPPKDTSSMQSTKSMVTEQAYESGQEVSSAEKEKEERLRREEVMQQYSIYSDFGLTYDDEKDSFSYDGKIVRYFSDKVSEENTNAFFYAEGTIDLNPVRDASGKLTELIIASDDEFKARTAKHVELEAEFQASGLADSVGSIEIGNPDAQDDTLSAYLEYGVSYNSSTKKWMYNDKVIHFFYDEDGSTTYIDYNATEGLNLKVIRSKEGKIESFGEITNAEISKIIN